MPFAFPSESAFAFAGISIYRANSVMSGFHADLEADRGTTKTFMINSGFAPGDADKLLGFMFHRTTFPCRLRTLSEIVEEERVERIDLLKVDVEKSERAVLAGIRPEHWGRIGQAVIEVHDEQGSLDEIEQLLATQGFKVSREQAPLLKGTTIFTVFASRRSAEPSFDIGLG